MGRYEQHIASVLGGNKRAFAELVAMFTDMARSIALSRLDDASLAEDVVQEAFLAAFVNLALLKDHKAFPGWLRTIVLRHCERARRERARAMPQSYSDPEAVPCESQSDPYHVCTRHLDRDMIRSILATLPDVAREACIQRFVYGQRYSEIAKALGVPGGTIKRRLHDARNTIIKEVRRRRGKALRLGYMPVSDHLLAMVAHRHQARGERALLLKQFLSWPSLVRSLAGGHLDAAFVMAPLAMALFNSGLGIRYVLDGHHDGSAVTLRSGCTRADIGDGSLVALPHALSTHRLLLHRLLGLGGQEAAPQSDLLHPYISPSYIPSSLARREIVGFSCSEPWNTRSVVRGEGRILAHSGEVLPGHICCVLVVRDAFSREHPELLAHVLASLKSAGQFIGKDPAGAARIQSRYTGVDRGVTESILQGGHVDFTDLDPDIGRAEQAMRLSMDAGVLTKPCDLGRFVDTAFL